MTEHLYLTPRSSAARNESEMAALHAEAKELRATLAAEEARGRSLRPPAMRARARLTEVEREIDLAESTPAGGMIVRVPERPCCRVRAQQYADPVPYWETPASRRTAGVDPRQVLMSANAGGGSPAARWAAVWSQLHPNEPAFVS